MGAGRDNSEELKDFSAELERGKVEDAVRERRANVEAIARRLADAEERRRAQAARMREDARVLLEEVSSCNIS